MPPVSNHVHPRVSRGLMLLCLMFAPLFGVVAADDVAVGRVLVLGPTAPVSNLKDDYAGDMLKNNLIYQVISTGLPKAGDTAAVLGESAGWTAEKPDALPAAFSEDKNTALLSFNGEVSRFSKGDLKITWNGETALYLDGKPAKGDAGTFSLKLAPGSHHFLVLLTRGESDPDGLTINWNSDMAGTRFHTQPERRVSAELMFHPAQISAIQISPDGKEVQYAQRGWDEAGNKWRGEAGILNTADGSTARLIFNVQESSWSPDGKHLAMLESGGLFVVNTQTGERTRLLADTKEVSGIVWSPDGASIFFHKGKEGKKRDDGVKRFQAVEDRWSYWRYQSHIYQVGLAGWVKTVTSGELASSLWDISKDGKRILLSRSPLDYTKPPHSFSTLHQLDLTTGKEQALGQFANLTGASYSNKGIYLALEPTAFDDLGNTLPKDRIPNLYEGELYHLDPKTGKAEALTRDFDPSISSFKVLDNDDVVMLVTDKDMDQAYHFKAADKSFRKLPLDMERVRLMDAAAGDNPRLVFVGSSTYRSQRLITLNLNDKAAKIIYDPAQGAYDQAIITDVTTWPFQHDGYEIDGRIYKPPGFDPAKKYPALVYYYGGVVPVGRAFTGRYPYHLWAASGYVVYVMQPRGTVGYGQQFAADHVNAWGKGSAEDVIEATKAFLDAHDFVDRDRVGCLGASYGGFMTMYLITRTNLFSAAISHAGISSLTGYWGYGWWGYSYNGIAGAGSWPWNNQDQYVGQSPIFAADKVETPLMLLHGTADTNVPIGQSHNMYTALKLQGKEVELVTFDGEGHWILDHDKRLIWWDTILSWFDKHLKDEPEWWNSVHP